MKTIAEAPVLLRIAAPRGGTIGVDREARVLQGISVITRGEALGHGLWIDEAFLDSVVKAGNKVKGGIKSRWTHGNLSGDGLGEALGRVKNFSRDGMQVRADLHLLESASEAPDGDLAGYIMRLADEDPEQFGMSIVFDPDFGEMARFRAKHTDKDGNFISPDVDNERHLEHARLSKLERADAVADPAANPAGLFSAFAPGSELASQAEAMMAYALGLSETEPAGLAGGPHPARARAFVAGFLERHGLRIESGTQESRNDAATPGYGHIVYELGMAERVEALESRIKELGKFEELEATLSALDRAVQDLGARFEIMRRQGR